MRFFVSMPDGDVLNTFMPQYVKEYLAAKGEVIYNSTGHNLTSAELGEYLEDVDVVIGCWGMPCVNSEALAKANRLKTVAYFGGSVAAIVSPELYAKGIKVLSGNLMFAESVAEGVIAYAMASMRNIPQYSTRLQNGGWHEPEDTSKGLLDAKVSLIGFGAIPSFLCPMLKPFRCSIRAFDKYAPQEKFDALGVERVDNLEELFRDADIVSVHLPKTAETKDMIDGHLLSLIPDGALFINTARGAVIKENELVAELAKGRFKAALDVFQQEPLAEDSPLRKMDNVLLMPHMAGPTLDRRPIIARTIIDEAARGGESRYEIGEAYAMRMTKEG